MVRLNPKQYISFVLKGAFQQYLAEEYRFYPPRRFRFDWAIPCFKLAIEYEGIMNGNSRHTTGVGYTRDTRKYNIAALEGWIVLRYTALSYEDITKDIQQFITLKQHDMRNR